MANTILDSLLDGNNYPSHGYLEFNSSDHIRYQNGKNTSGHNYNCHRKIKIENSITGNEGYSVTIYNLDGIHPIWRNNIQMSPKRMRIIKTTTNIIELRGFGFDSMGAPFSNYGITIFIENDDISKIQLNIFDRHINILYMK
ncbi:MAG: hypothetical protein K2M94_06650 [Paramuribaculum sp.]|nr:hypothetical protein [Paramuribaculum sp.]